ncbi:MAG: 3-oxoacyl-[acyl-carrier protein] reductase [Chloroflexota bacterium]|nr:3-oxoacyl-[acyl-carrier protein] reductase [Chloroflexota bacterium]
MGLEIPAGHVGLVTGASGGIGRAVARDLAAAGVRVALGYGGGRERAERVAEEIANAGGEAWPVGADLADPLAPAAQVGAVIGRFGRLDLLVCNAGLGERRDWPDVTLEDWERTMAVNLRAPFLAAQAALPGMVERGFGRILFVSSVAAFTGGLVGPHYAASKAGLHALTAFLAGRVAAAGVTVNAIAPALIEDTGMLPGPTTELAARVPVGRLGRPEEVADLAMAMLRNPYLTSKVVVLDGGALPR